MARQTLVAEGDTVHQLPRAAARMLDRPSLLASSRARARAALLVIPLLLFIVIRQLLMLTDPDYWWHLRTGQFIFETGTLPRADIFSYTAAGQPWVTHEWLTELLLYLVYRSFGYVGNVVLFGLIAVLTWLVVYATCRLRGVGELGATVLSFCSFGMAMASVNVRPQVMTLLLLAVGALLVTRYKQGHTRALWLFPPLLALWVNLHGGYVIGLVLLGLTLVGEGLDWIRRRSAAPPFLLPAVTVLSALATLVNPHGLEALLYPFTYAGTGNASMRLLEEWQSPDFHNPLFFLFAASLLLAMVLGLNRRPLGSTETLWALALGFMALQSTRHVALYAVVVAPLLAARLQEEVPSLRRSLAAWRRQRLVLAWPLVIAGAVALMIVRAPQEGAVLQLAAEPSPASYPAGAVSYLRAHNLQGNLFNAYVWGGYLIYKLYPERPVFIDGRADVYGDARVGRAAATEALAPGWRETLDEQQVQLVLVKKNSPLAVALLDDSGWQEAFSGEVERLFVRQSVARDVAPS